MSISPFIFSLGMSEFPSNGGQYVGSPSKRGLHACAGGSVTGAVHPTNINGNSINFLIIWPKMIVSHYVVYHNSHRNQQYGNHPDYTPNNHGSKNPNASMSNVNIVI